MTNLNLQDKNGLELLNTFYLPQDTTLNVSIKLISAGLVFSLTWNLRNRTFLEFFGPKTEAINLFPQPLPCST